MKLPLACSLFLSAALSTSEAFSFYKIGSRSRTFLTRTAFDAATESTMFFAEKETKALETIDPEATEKEEEKPMNPYEAIGISEEALALGINPEEVFSYLGTREDLIKKTMTDIPSFDRPKAEEEVDKLLLDNEALTMYIQFQKMKEQDPDFEVPEQREGEGLISVRNIAIAYFGYIALTRAPVVFRQWVAEQQNAGAWQGTNIPFIDDWIEKTPMILKSADTASDAVQAVSDAVQSAADVGVN